MNKFYVTNAIPYVNAKPHIGHALEFIQSDVIARFHKLLGENVLLLCGGDENAIKNVQAAEKAGKPIQDFIDENTQSFFELSKNLNIQFDVWQKGSNPEHHKSSQKLWELCAQNGDIYKKKYKGLYCVGCELFYTKEELNEKGECYEHPGKPLEEVEEENYFFKLSTYKKHLTQIIEDDTIQIVPAHRKNEVLAFLKGEVEDISISRSNKRAKNWGVPVPEDDSQRMYVWFDALNIYQSGIGFEKDEQMYKKWWPADLHVIGKGILRFHAVYWPAFLLSAKLELPKKIFVHDYFTVNGQKMSKSLGNVIDPNDFISKYGADALRYYCLAKFSPFSDGDFSEDKFKEVYNADLANGLGNLVARIAKLCEKSNYEAAISNVELKSTVKENLEQFKFNDALSSIWYDLSELDKKINKEEPWKLTDKELESFLNLAVKTIQISAFNLKPFLPETSEKILNQFSGKVTAQKPLFPRI